MSEGIRFHLDENVDPAIALGLRRYGIDVTTTNDVELRTQTDEVQLVFISGNTASTVHPRCRFFDYCKF